MVKKNDDLFRELTSVNRKHEESKALIGSLMAQNEQLQKELDAKAVEIEALETQLKSREELYQNEKTVQPDSEACESDVTEALSNVDEAEAVDIMSHSPVTPERKPHKIEEITADYGAAVEIASASIGDVVLKCTELCALFAENGGSNAKDLVNLALGRTEVFKSEALGIIEESEDVSYIIRELECKKRNALEYFDLLKKQV